MKTNGKILLGFLAFVVFFAVVYYAYNTLSSRFRPNLPASSETGGSAGESGKTQAPDFTVYDEKGNKVKLSDFKEKPVVLNFWASWCPPCKGEMPHFDSQYQKEKDNVVFLMIDLVDGQRETQEKGQNYVKEQGFAFPVYFDKEQEAANTYGISAIPDTVFIDRDGYIVNAYQGAIDEATLAAGIESIKK